MDPTECLREILAAFYCKDRESAVDRLEYLSKWVNRGGLLPKIDLLGPADLQHPDPDRIRVAV